MGSSTDGHFPGRISRHTRVTYGRTYLAEVSLHSMLGQFVRTDEPMDEDAEGSVGWEIVAFEPPYGDDNSHARDLGGSTGPYEDGVAYAEDVIGVWIALARTGDIAVCPGGCAGGWATRLAGEGVVEVGAISFDGSIVRILAIEEV